jgi:hypothetical protein
MSWEITLRGEKSQFQKVTNFIIPSTQWSCNEKIRETERRLVVARNQAG